MRIVLTGATGFFGGRIADALLKREHQVIALTRGAGRLAHRVGLFEREADFTNLSASDLELLGTADAVVHAAAVVKAWARHADEFDRVNVAGSEAFLKAAADAGVKKIVYVSSFIALGPDRGGGLKTEKDYNPGPWRNDYERTKTLGLRAVRKLKAGGAPIQIVFPGVLYGPGPITDGNLVVKIILDLVAKKVPGYIGTGKVSWSYTAVAEAAKAVATLVEQAPSDQDYCLGGDNRTTRDFYDVLPKVLGAPIPDKSIPYWLGKTVGAMQLARAYLTGKQPMLTPGVVEIYKESWPLDSAAAVRDLGYTPPTLEEGLTRTVEWLRKEGKL
jgi:nucleoside-diphosphate-sugar epimerase